MIVGVVEGVAVQDHARVPAADRLHLDGRRCARHDDRGPNAEFLGRQGHALGVVAGRGADHPALQRLARKPGHLVVGAAQLEGKDRLQVLALEQDWVAEPGGEARHGVERALDRDIVDPGRQHLAGIAGEVRACFALAPRTG